MGVPGEETVHDQDETFRNQAVAASGWAETNTVAFAATTQIASGSYSNSDIATAAYDASISSSAASGQVFGTTGVQTSNGTFSYGEHDNGRQIRLGSGSFRSTGGSMNSAGYSSSGNGQYATGGAYSLDQRTSLANLSTSATETYNENNGPGGLVIASSSTGSYVENDRAAQSFLATEGFVVDSGSACSTAWGRATASPTPAAATPSTKEPPSAGTPAAAAPSPSPKTRAICS